MTFWQLTSQHVGLEDAGLVIAPFSVPNVLVFQDFGNDGFTGAVEPKLTIRFDCGFQSIDHAQNSHCRSQPVKKKTKRIRYFELFFFLMNYDYEFFLVPDQSIEEKPKQ